jgi:hypothetical protein
MSEPLTPSDNERIEQLCAQEYTPDRSPLYFHAMRQLSAEVTRLRQGQFTNEEFQHLCHNVDVQQGFEAFAADCAEYQHRLFGKSLGRPFLQPRSEWHEDYGDVLWWHLPIEEPPHFGTPISSDWPANGDEYYTHWSKVLYPAEAYADLSAQQTEKTNPHIKAEVARAYPIASRWEVEIFDLAGRPDDPAWPRIEICRLLSERLAALCQEGRLKL